MRREFSDKYNLVTIQCDYFGWKFMQSDEEDITFNSIDLDNLRESLSEEQFEYVFNDNKVNYDKLIKSNLTKENIIKFRKNMSESLENFCDMGIMQAMDNVTATLFVMNVIYSNEKIFNTSKVMIMRHSHGSYLAYLCNYVCQGLYTHILDNSAWVYPNYFTDERSITYITENKMLYNQVEYYYLAKEKKIYLDELDLHKLYKGYDNKCKIVAYHGSDDQIINYEKKYNALKDTNNICFNYIDKTKVDGVVFKSTLHGLDADFIKLFDKFYFEYVYKDNKKSRVLDFRNNVDMGFCKIDYTKNLPYIFL